MIDTGMSLTHVKDRSRERGCDRDTKWRRRL